MKIPASSKKLILALVLVSLFLSLSHKAFAQDLGIGIAKYFKVDGGAEDGDIVVTDASIFTKSTKEYAPSVIGVVTEKPALELRTGLEDAETDYAIVSEGTVFVKASTINGDIKQGDSLTTSNIPGVAMKSSRPNVGIGSALEDLSGIDPQQPKKIKAELHLSYSQATSSGTSRFPFPMADLFKYDSPSALVKYIFAAAVVVIFTIFGVRTFGKVALEGVRAVGRNPLASKAISLSILLNVVITVVIILAGLILAYLILLL